MAKTGGAHCGLCLIVSLAGSDASNFGPAAGLQWSATMQNDDKCEAQGFSQMLPEWLPLLLIMGLALPSAAVSAAGEGQTPLAEAAGQPANVVSINLCADQLLLLLADPGQIASLSNLSTDRSGSYYYLEARQYPLNRGVAEQLLPYKPELVIAGQFTSKHTLSLLRELGLRVETLAIANSVQALTENIRLVAGWLGQAERGESIVLELQTRLDNLPAPDKHQPKAAVYDPNGYTVGEQTLRGQALKLAGWHNVATDAGIENYGRLSLEQLIRLAPEALLESPYSPGTYSRGQALGRHPALRKVGLDPIIIEVPSRMTICAGPWTLDVVDLLVQQRLNLQQTGL